MNVLSFLSIHPIRMKIFILIIILICAYTVIGTEIRLLQDPSSSQLKQINLLRSIYRYRSRTISLRSQIYKCLTPMKQIPSKQKKQNSMQQLPIIPTILPNNASEFDKLDILKDDVGVVHTTKQFLYKYVHKSIVSQYDDETTKYMNQKQVYENFTIGLYQKVSQGDKTAAATKTKSGEQKIVDVLALAEVQDGNSNLYEIDRANNIIRTTTPLYSDTLNKHLNFQILVQMQQNEQSFASLGPNSTTNEQKKQMKLQNFYGIAITNYELQIARPIPLQYTITKVVNVRSLQESPKTVPPFQKGIIPKTTRIIYTSRVDQMCSVNKNTGIQVNQTLLLTLKPKSEISKYRTNLQKKVKQKLDQLKIDASQINLEELLTNDLEMDTRENTGNIIVTIKEIIGEHAYLLDQNLPNQWEIIRCLILKDRDDENRINYHGVIELSTQQQRQKLQTQFPVQFKQLLVNQQFYRREVIHFSYIGQRIFKNTHNQAIQAGSRFYCFFNLVIQSISYNGTVLLTVPLTVGQPFDSNKQYYEFYPKSGEDGSFEDFMDITTDKMVCIRQYYKEKNRESESRFNYKHTNKYQTFYKLVKDDQIQILQKSEKEESQKEEEFYIVVPSPDCIIELQIPSSQKKLLPHKNSRIIITLQQLYKIGYFPNNTKYEQLENSYYENLTSTSPIVITKNALYRFGDLLKFPRMLLKNHLQNPQIFNLKVRYGYAFIRKIRISKEELLNNQLFALSEDLYPTSTYNTFHRPEKSIATDNRFTGGHFCGGNINKNRQILVKMRCGQPWLKIDKIRQIQPCSYEISLISQFLCQKKIIFTAKPNTIVPYLGSICIPEELLFE